MTRAKICGVTSPDDLRAVADAGADAVGVITDVPVDSPRAVDPSEAASLVADAPPFLTTTLVTMPDSPGRAAELAEVVQPDVLQLHADFDADSFRYLRAETRARIVAVVPADESERALDLEGAVDAVLVDSASDDGAGGTGRTHDWERTRELVASLSTPVLLAGGLTPENVADAVRAVDPYAVDVASGVEAEGGVKDHDAVRAFVRNATRAADGDEADAEAAP